MTRSLLEAGLVALSGLALGLLVNALSDDGLDLGRNHFPRSLAELAASEGVAPATAGEAPTEDQPAASASPSGADVDGAGRPPPPGPSAAGLTGTDPVVLARLRDKGLQPLDHAGAVAAWKDPMREYGATLFVDARREEDYRAGHIPGAYALDPFHPERHQAEMLALIPGTQRIVVYCNGGECEDSETAAQLLLLWGADPSIVWVDVGGIAAWREAGLPLEVGKRDSGEFEGGEAPG